MSFCFKFILLTTLLSKTCLNRELRSTKTSSTESILSEQNFTDSPKHVEAAEDPSFGIHVNIFGNIESIDETPNDLGKNDSVYSCKHKDPCLNKFHQNRTYYPAYRSLLFILCYRNDFCIELACPFNYIWNSTLGYCKDQEEVEVYQYNLDDLKKVDDTSLESKYDMRKYDCLSRYPCVLNQQFTSRAVYRHVDAHKFIVCFQYDCSVHECASHMNWYQDLHRCLIPIDHVRLLHLMNVTEEDEDTESYIRNMKTGFYDAYNSSSSNYSEENLLAETPRQTNANAVKGSKNDDEQDGEEKKFSKKDEEEINKYIDAIHEESKELESEDGSKDETTKSRFSSEYVLNKIFPKDLFDEFI